MKLLLNKNMIILKQVLSLLLLFSIASCTNQKLTKGNSNTKALGFIHVSSQNPKYLAYEDSTPFIPVGPNICWSRTTVDPDKALVQYNHYFQRLSENNGNFTRIWLSAPLWEVELEKAKKYNVDKAEYLLDSLINMASHYGIKIKFCFHNFRELLNRPAPFAGSVPFDFPIYHIDNGGTVSTMDEFFNTEPGHDLFIGRMKFFAGKYGSNPTIFGWELWNEINSVNTSDMPNDILKWTDAMLSKGHEIFPRHLLMQSMGSFASENSRHFYKDFCLLGSNDIAQVHRYLDPGASFEVCKGPMDILASDAAKELLSYKPGKPFVVAEIGAVEANHTGPSKLYEVDTLGVLLHDLLFAPFFSGAAGPGQSWHWHHYIDKHDLWWHYGRFTEAVKGINPITEDFEPMFENSKQTRNYILKGKNTDIIWMRDKTSDWKNELVNRIPAKEISGISIEAEGKNAEAYLPWEDKWVKLKVKNGKTELPSFVRSIVVRIVK